MAEQKKLKINMGTFDLIKGIAILDVVFSHIIFNYSMDELMLFSPLFLIEKLIGQGLMPMFFIISGYGIKKKDASKMLKQSFSQLIVPYLCASFSILVLYSLFHWRINGVRNTILEVTERLHEILVCGHITGPLWYFIALFWAENIINSVLKIKSESCQVLTVAAAMAFGFTLQYLEFFSFKMIQGFTATGFVYLGYILKKKNLMEKLIRSPWTYVVLVPIWLGQLFGVWLMGLNYLNIEMVLGKYPVITLFASGCAGLLFVLLGVLFDKAKWRCLDLFRSLGAQTYWILIAHTVDYHSVPWFEMRYESRSLYLSFLTDVFFRVVFISMGCSIIKKILQHRYMRKRMNQIAKNAKCPQCK